MNEYTHPEMLVDGAWLEARLHEPGIRIVDCDQAERWERAHLPGAVQVKEHYFKNPDSSLFIMAPHQFAATMGEMGIGDDTLVIAYDSSGARYSGRLWWCLNYYGHTAVKVLDGGWPKWFLEGRPVSIERTEVARAQFTPRANSAMYATADDVKAAIGRHGVVVLDVRSDSEWAGTETRGNRRTGRIPGSVHVEWLNNVTADQVQLLRPAADLRAMYAGKGVTPDKEVITVCQAGVRAAQAAMTLRLLGYEHVRTYDGSFAEWGNRDDTPIEK